MMNPHDNILGHIECLCHFLACHRILWIGYWHAMLYNEFIDPIVDVPDLSHSMLKIRFVACSQPIFVNSGHMIRRVHGLSARPLSSDRTAP